MVTSEMLSWTDLTSLCSSVFYLQMWAEASTLAANPVELVLLFFLLLGVWATCHLFFYSSLCKLLLSDSLGRITTMGMFSICSDVIHSMSCLLGTQGSGQTPQLQQMTLQCPDDRLFLNDHIFGTHHNRHLCLVLFSNLFLKKRLSTFSKTSLFLF